MRNQLNRIEVALNTLIDSITFYSPSLEAATDLLTADDGLTESLKQRADPSISQIVTHV